MKGHQLLARGLLRYLVAAGVSVPVGAVAWFEVVHLYFGLSGEDPPVSFSYAAAIVAFGLALGWSLYGAARPAEVVRRACGLGLLVAFLLPVVAIAVLLLWQSASDRPDLGMGGLMLYSMPIVAFAAAAVLAVSFWTGFWLAERRLQKFEKSEPSQ